MSKRIKTFKRKLKKQWKTLGPKQQQGLGLIFSGLILVLIFSGWRVRELTLLGFKGQWQQTVNHESQIARIEINKIKLDLAVEPAVVNDGSWEISDSGVSHWASSANPGDKGNIVIYGHNKLNLFGPIRWLNVGDEIKLIDVNGIDHIYQIAETVTVKTNQIEYIQPKNEEVLTLYTCSGFFDKDRYLVISRPVQ
ncbi:MAG: sortase [Candidatus Beckwithbacteria bacterium]